MNNCWCSEQDELANNPCSSADTIVFHDRNLKVYERTKPSSNKDLLRLESLPLR